MLRILGHPRYPNSPGSPAAVAPLLAELTALAGHGFWPDDISLLDAGRVQAERLLQAAQVTGAYLLALAAKRGGRLANFDARPATGAVRGGAAARRLID